jgi:hypothetical protein
MAVLLIVFNLSLTVNHSNAINWTANIHARVDQKVRASARPTLVTMITAMFIS